MGKFSTGIIRLSGSLLGGKIQPRHSDLPTGANQASEVREGRHTFLLREALGMVNYVDGEAELFANLQYVRA
jgi:hypothetical protein